jgi:hypothetical protein
MRVKVLQTADTDRYKPMLDITAQAARRFSETQGADYVQFVGIKRGCHPWHAAFNRIVMLSDLVRQGFEGWAIYLDADAYPFDLRFDLPDYLAAHQRWALIGAAGGSEPHMVNSGILLLNLGQAAAQDVVRSWQAAFDVALPDDRLKAADDWLEVDDQTLLHHVLRAHSDVDSVVKIEGFELIGWPYSRFLRQMLRQFGDFDTRCDRLREGVAEALREGPAAERLMAAFKGKR